VRWAESARRSKRRQIEQCRRVANQSLMHPIINWSTEEVWSYLRSREIETCCLYREGWKRIVCVLCPYSRTTAREIARWPGIARVWRRINDACYEELQKTGREVFPSADAQWEWWLDRDRPPIRKEEYPLFDGLEEEEEESCPLYDEGLEE